MFRVQTNHTDENRTHAKRMAESTQAALFQFSKNLEIEHNFGTNYVQQPKFHCLPNWYK